MPSTISLRPTDDGEHVPNWISILDKVRQKDRRFELKRDVPGKVTVHATNAPLNEKILAQLSLFTTIELVADQECLWYFPTSKGHGRRKTFPARVDVSCSALWINIRDRLLPKMRTLSVRGNAAFQEAATYLRSRPPQSIECIVKNLHDEEEGVSTALTPSSNGSLVATFDHGASSELPAGERRPLELLRVMVDSRDPAPFFQLLVNIDTSQVEHLGVVFEDTPSLTGPSPDEGWCQRVSRDILGGGPPAQERFGALARTIENIIRNSPLSRFFCNFTAFSALRICAVEVDKAKGHLWPTTADDILYPLIAAIWEAKRLQSLHFTAPCSLHYMAVALDNFPQLAELQLNCPLREETNVPVPTRSLTEDFDTRARQAQVAEEDATIESPGGFGMIAEVARAAEISFGVSDRWLEPGVRTALTPANSVSIDYLNGDSSARLRREAEDEVEGTEGPHAVDGTLQSFVCIDQDIAADYTHGMQDEDRAEPGYLHQPSSDGDTPATPFEHNSDEPCGPKDVPAHLELGPFEPRTGEHSEALVPAGIHADRKFMELQGVAFPFVQYLPILSRVIRSHVF